MRRRLRALWQLVRQLATDDAYERYLAHHAAKHSASPPLNRRDFYLREQQHKWGGVNRCC
jgi:uncharacterized short protein YbdD (DUF466 family)